MIGGVLTYEIKPGGRACGQTIGADGSGEFAVVINGTPDDAEQWARDYLRKIEASGAKLGRVVFVRSEECFTGPMVMEVTPNAWILYGDDGERMCNTRMVDFNRDSAAEIERKIHEHNMRKLAQILPEWAELVGVVPD